MVPTRLISTSMRTEKPSSTSSKLPGRPRSDALYLSTELAGTKERDTRRRSVEARRKIVPRNFLANGRTIDAPAGIAMSPVTISHHPYEEDEDDESACETPGEVLAEDSGMRSPHSGGHDAPRAGEECVVEPVVRAVEREEHP